MLFLELGRERRNGGKVGVVQFHNLAALITSFLPELCRSVELISTE
jgi:hypothetical protein